MKDRPPRNSCLLPQKTVLGGNAFEPLHLSLLIFFSSFGCLHWVKKSYTNSVSSRRRTNETPSANTNYLPSLGNNLLQMFVTSDQTVSRECLFLPLCAES